MAVKKRVLFLFTVAVLTGSGAFGQITKLTSATGFSPNSVKLNFVGYESGADASGIFQNWGIVFQGELAGPSIHSVSSALLAQTVLLLTNRPSSGPAENGPMIINLRWPVRRAGFWLTNGGAGITANITAYDPLGTNLGAIVQQGVSDDPFTPTFVGLSTTSTRGISKIVIDYASANAEELQSILVDYLERPRFNTYLAQLGDGGGLQTTIVISNLSDSTATGSLRLRTSNGEPLALKVNGQAGNEFNFNIPARSSATFETGGDSNPVVAGYASVSSNVPVEGTAIFRVLNNGNVVTEAGVGSDRGSYRAVGAVQRSSLFNSGIAAANPGANAADVTVRIFNESGTLVGSDISAMDLEGGHHRARFLTELFNNLPANFQGTVELSSNRPLAVVIIRTAAGLPMSSLPVGSLER